MKSLTHVGEDATKSLLIYSVDNLFSYACEARFKNIYQIDITTSTSVVQTLIENTSYELAIFDTLYIGQCDNLIRHLGNAGTYIIIIMATQEQERYYASCQQILGIHQVFRKPATSENYKMIIDEIDKRY
tara:strand:+ start:822 stop:1211 length:390 start_codon:yes stop_codon:yes gene_type:complete